ncbi:DUF1656 domain-containing protein [Budviciaceae bacterium CWB-B4]|uniref:DUF1656 domain-containing protein n=1 Tax=Limnobaculum xujianqingii TaxID=2738837 RepID=A0A9D7AHG7_9GAMM|nr:DUF1656 domain-containing protein [Limnobaculum xujianqingii]MBK5072783.1 DUF1656 domain-containing protein [Limnobaculum xujianqingii]MBK5176092.1 DUF1656 domain-containing protein [Limnobaculum xujianqingii]
MDIDLINKNSALSDLVFGASLYFPPIFKALFLGFIIWLLVHRVIRDWLYSGDIWHPTLMDLSIFIIAVSGSMWMLTHW